MKNHVSVVTVTYGNRFHFLKHVVNSALREGASKVIIVDNNSAPECREKLRDYEEKLGIDKIKVLYLDDNYGSAVGYKRGLEEAYNHFQCEFIWLLDDDNKPQKGSLRELKEFWNNLNDINKEEKICLLSYRFKKEQLALKSIIYNKPELVLGLKNSFSGFHINELHKKIFRYLKRIFKLGNNISVRENNKSFGVVPVAPYGGMFFHKNLLDKIGYPREDFFLYGDDHEWSYRITKESGKIYLILDSLIDDIDLSWIVPKNNTQTAFSIIANGEPFRVYYSIRNRVFFEVNNIVDKKLVYWINMIIFIILISFSSTRNVKFILRAVRDGLKGKLGKIDVLI